MEAGAHGARLDVLERQQAETFRRLRVVDRLDERSKAIAGDVAELRSGVASCAENCQAIRAYVDAELARAKREAAGENLETRKLKASEKVAIIGAIAVVFASIIAALASLAAAGVFG